MAKTEFNETGTVTPKRAYRRKRKYGVRAAKAAVATLAATRGARTVAAHFQVVQAFQLGLALGAETVR